MRKERMVEERKQVDIDRQDFAPLEINTIATKESRSHVTPFFYPQLRRVRDQHFSDESRRKQTEPQPQHTWS